MIRFVIPVYNERENIANLIADLAPRARELGARIIFVDDGSTDGTAEVIEAHRQDLHLAIVRHQVNRGLGTAINSGLRAALGESQDDDAIVTIEGDNTSDLDDLPRMLAQFQQGSDVVLASVYAPGGRIVGVAPWRLAASKAVSNSFRYVGGLKEIHTLSSLYRVYRAGHPAPRRRDLRLAARPRARLRRQRRAAAQALQRRRLGLGGADGQRLEPAPGRLEDEPQAHGDGLRPPHGRPHRRPHPAAAAVAARRRRGAAREHAPPAGGRVTPRVGIVGGGVLGTTLALRLQQAGANVTLLERGPSLGGLAGAFDFGGHRIDRFYHVIVPVRRAHAVARRRARPERASELLARSGVGFFADGKMYPLQRPGRLRPLPGALAAGARAPGVVRGPVPAAQGPRRAGGRAARQLAAPSLRRRRSSTASGARCSTRASTPTTPSCPPRTSGRARTACARRARRRARARPWAACAAATSA